MKKIFLVLLLLLYLQGHSQQINYAEYFIDNPVAQGSGTPISIGTASDSINTTINIPITGLSVGFHNLNIRVRYTSGVWSLFENRVFYVNPNFVNPTSPKIAKAEYFIDSDTLGVGKRTVITTGSLSDSLNITSNINISNLSPGFHNLFIRTQDSTGIWGMFENRAFYINQASSSVSTPKITKVEYFIDSDTLGVGKRTVITTGSLADSVNITSNINISGLSPGFHNLFIRTQDSAGVWGMFESRAFYINQNNIIQNAPKLVAAEYFYNTDPGMGNGTAINPSFATADSINLNRNMPITGLSNGIDTLYVRVKDITGAWSLPFYQEFRICNAAPNAPTLNGNANYNVCDGGNASFSATPASGASIFWVGPNEFTSTSNTINLTNITNLSEGTYYAYSVTGATACDTSGAIAVNVSVKNAPIAESLIVNGSLDFCNGDSVILSIPSQSGYKYRWLKNANNTTNNGDTLNTLVVKTSGTYTVKVTNTNGCFSNMIDEIVTINPKPNTSAINGNNNVLIGSTETYSVTNSAGSNYNWTVTNGTINSGNGTNSISVNWPSIIGTGSVKVIETNSTNCKGDFINLPIVIANNPDNLSLSTQTVNSSKSGDNTNIAVTSNRSWTVISNQTWATINPSSGSGNGVFIITTTPNSNNTRTAIISVTAGTITKNITVNQDGSVGINDITKTSNINIYPNPTSGFITISSSQAIANINVYDVTGKLVYNQQKNDKQTNTELDLSTLSNGIYFIHAVTENGGVSKSKVVVSR